MYPSECTEENHHYQHYPSFFFNDTATTEIYTLSLHDALPIYAYALKGAGPSNTFRLPSRCRTTKDRKSTRLNSSHDQISYAVFCLKKKKASKAISAPTETTSLAALTYVSI